MFFSCILHVLGGGWCQGLKDIHLYILQKKRLYF